MSIPYTDGDVINGYKLDKKLFETHRYTLFEATSVDIGRLAFVEIWHRNAEKFPEAFEFMKGLARVKDPNIAGLYDLGLVDDKPLLFIIYQHSGGTPLREHLANLQQPEVEHDYRLGRRYIDTVRELNEQSNGLTILSGLGAECLHHTASPNQQADLFLCGWHRYALHEVLITSHIVNDEGVFHVDPSYISPEYIENQERTEAGQQYIIALAICEFLRREPVLSPEDNPITMFMNHINPGLDINAILPDLSPTLQAPLGRALARDPKDRHPSLEAFGEAMDKALSEHLASHPFSETVYKWTLEEGEQWDHGITIMANPKGSRYVEGSTSGGAQDQGDNIGGRQGARFSPPWHGRWRLTAIVMGIVTVIIVGALFYGLIVLWSLMKQFFESM